MKHALLVMISLAISIGGCGGGGTANDAATSAPDTGNAVDAATGNDAAMSMDDAATTMDDAATTMDDTGATTDTGAGGACTNSADQAVLAGGTVDGVVSMCGNDNLGAEPATRTCIESMSGLTMACADCFDDQVHCGVMHCAVQCAGGNTPSCMTCLATHCNAAFQMCSGLTG